MNTVTKTRLSDRMREYGIRAKQVQEVTIRKEWGSEGKGFSESMISAVSYGERNCPQLEDLIEELIRRAEFIYSV